MKKMIAILVATLMLVMPAAFSDSATMSVTVGSAGPNVDSVTVADADPTSGTTTEITITSQITDTNGVDDINIVNMSFTVGNPANEQLITTTKMLGSFTRRP